MSLIEQAEKFKKAIQKITAKEITSQTEKCLRLYKAVVVSVANGTTMGVQLVGDGTTLYLPYSTDAQSATISNVVWVQVIANNFRNATIITQADIQHTASVEPGDLSQYQTKTDNSLETPDKTVVGAINEVNSDVTRIQGQISQIIGGETVVGSAETATQLETTRTFSITGDVTASAQNFNGTQNVVLTATLPTQSVTPNTTYTAFKVTSKGIVASAGTSIEIGTGSPSSNLIVNGLFIRLATA